MVEACQMDGRGTMNGVLEGMLEVERRVIVFHKLYLSVYP